MKALHGCKNPWRMENVRLGTKSSTSQGEALLKNSTGQGYLRTVLVKGKKYLRTV
jgi:hypothetical protein